MLLLELFTIFQRVFQVILIRLIPKRDLNEFDNIYIKKTHTLKKKTKNKKMFVYRKNDFFPIELEIITFPIS